MRKAYSYVRFSRPEQLRGASLKRQMERSATWCQENKYQLDNSLNLRDLGISAFKGANVTKGKLGAFLKAVDEGLVSPGSAIIVESLDRMSRQQVVDAMELFLSIINRGITIVSIDPSQTFSRESVNKNPMELMMVVMILGRAYEESSTKSTRVADAWEKKRQRLGTEKMTARCPSWMKLVGNDFRLTPDRVKVVQRIFAMVKDGYGVTKVAKVLNEDGVKPFTHADGWHRSTIEKIVTNRSVLGEFTPHFGRNHSDQSKRKPAGEPVPNYYPAIISEDVFHAAQSAMKTRRLTTKGGPSTRIANLFTGILKSQNGFPYVIIDKGSGMQMVCSGEARGLVKRPLGLPSYVAFSYLSFEAAFLELCSGLTANDLYPKRAKNDKAQKLAQLTGRLGEIDHKLTEIEKAMDEGEISQLLDKKAKQLEAERKEIISKIEQAKSELTAESNVLATTQNLTKLLAEATPENLYDIRARLKSQIAALVETIHVAIQPMPPDYNFHRMLTATVIFRDGIQQDFQIERTMKYKRGSKDVPVPYFEEIRAYSAKFKGLKEAKSTNGETLYVAPMMVRETT